MIIVDALAGVFRGKPSEPKPTSMSQINQIKGELYRELIYPEKCAFDALAIHFNPLKSTEDPIYHLPVVYYEMSLIGYDRLVPEKLRELLKPVAEPQHRRALCLAAYSIPRDFWAGRLTRLDELHPYQILLGEKRVFRKNSYIATIQDDRPEMVEVRREAGLDLF